MSKEWQEASTERAKEQNINPITGMSCISPFQPLLMGADYLAILIFWYDQVSALMDTPERDSSRLKQASRLGDLVVWVDDEDEMNVMRGRVVRAEVCIAYETGFESQDNEVYTWFDSKVQRSVCACVCVALGWERPWCIRGSTLPAPFDATTFRRHRECGDSAPSEAIGLSSPSESDGGTRRWQRERRGNVMLNETPGHELFLSTRWTWTSNCRWVVLYSPACYRSRPCAWIKISSNSSTTDSCDI